MLRVENLSLKAGDFRLREVSVGVEREEYFVLMGPTGSGKSLLARCVCGLIRPLSGTIRVGGRDVTALPPRHRHVGYVPQQASLFPHMTVARNITFALRGRRQSHRRALGRVGPLIDLLSLGSLLDRRPGTLSGGERQKVAIARALAASPKVLILDEPVSALDEPTRHEVCRELTRLHKELGVPTLHICHSVAEAHLVADRVGVLVAGSLVQTAPLSEALDHPATGDVARLLGAACPHRIFRPR